MRSTGLDLYKGINFKVILGELVMSFFEITRHSVLFSRYYYMRNFCDLIGQERWYFSLIWNTYIWKLQTFVGSSISNNCMDAIDCSQSPIFRKIVEIERYALFYMRYGLPSWMTTSSPGLFPSLFFREKPWRRGCLDECQNHNLHEPVVSL